jgi:hypothetical protein
VCNVHRSFRVHVHMLVGCHFLLEVWYDEITLTRGARGVVSWTSESLEEKIKI